jgi:hypothetical protein
MGDRVVAAPRGAHQIGLTVARRSPGHSAPALPLKRFDVTFSQALGIAGSVRREPEVLAPLAIRIGYLSCRA